MWSLALLASAFSPALGASYDPDLHWRTIQTEHFNVHFHQGEEQLADEFSGVVEQAYDTMTTELQWEPRCSRSLVDWGCHKRIELVLVDRTDDANGYAQVVPYSTIVIYVTGPQEDSVLADYEDWGSSITTHELTHILHMDANHGLVRAARAVVGRVASTNNLSPWWMIEGLATFQETRHTTGGRGRSPLVDMIKRTSVVEDDFPPLGNLDGLQPDPPGGNLRYLFGQDFLQYISDQTGEDVWTTWLHTYGGRVPYLLPGRKVFGEPITRLYKDWRDHLDQRYGAQADALRAQGLSHSRLISDTLASCTAPRFSPDGEKLVWSCYDLRTGSAIWMSDGRGNDPKKLLQDRGAKNFTWRSDSQAFVYAASHIVNQFNTWSDIYLHQLGKERPVPLTSAARARDPDFSPDGSQLMMVTNKVQNNQLEVLTVDRQRRALTHNTDHTQLSTPRYSPDGQVLAVSMWRDGRRDLWLFDTDGTPLRRLTADAAIDRDPEWSADGRTLYFCSYRSGVPNIYAIDVASERLWQVTNVLTGATKPSVSPDGSLLAFQQYSHDGWDVHILELDRSQWRDRGLLPRPALGGPSMASLTQPVERAIDTDADEVAEAWQVSDFPRWRARGSAVVGLDGSRAFRQDPDSIDTFDDIVVDDAFGEEQDYDFHIPPKRYNPLNTLPPRYISPWIQTTTELPSERAQRACPWLDAGASEGQVRALCPALQFSAATSASDALGRYGWSANMSYRTDAEFLGWGAAFTVNRWLPVYTVSASSRAIPIGDVPVVDPDDALQPDGSLKLAAGGRYWERRTRADITVSYPYALRTWVFAQYAMQERTNLFDLPANAWLPQVPMRGTEGSLSAGWRYSWSQQTPYAISLEDARIFSLVGKVLAPWLGTFVRDDQGNLQPLSQVQLTTELREYITNPLIPNHVLAVRGATGLTLGGTDFLGNYQLGGSFGDSAFYLTPDSFRMLRGYPFADDIGDMYWIAGAEYRLPLWRIERGLGPLPAYARRLSAVLFVDAGNAFPQLRTLSDATDQTLVGTGAELRLSSALGWGVFLTGRLGYGVGLTEGGYAPNDPGAWYLRVGGSF